MADHAHYRTIHSSLATPQQVYSMRGSRPQRCLTVWWYRQEESLGIAFVIRHSGVVPSCCPAFLSAYLVLEP